MKVVTDSIGKALPNNKLWTHELMTGKTLSDATQAIYSKQLKVGGLRVIAFHLGTNSVDYRVWGRQGITWEHRLEHLKEEVKALYRAVRKYNATCFIVFSAVLPRKCDWQHTELLYKAFNNSLKAFCRSKACGFMPTYSSFIHKEGPLKGRPIAQLFAKLDGGLHLNLLGRRLFGERFQMALSPKQLRSMAVAAGFRFVGGRVG